MYQKNTLSQRALNQKTTMKSISKKVPVVLLFSVLFTLLFFQKLIGINLLIFESILLLLASWLYKPKFNSLLSKSLLAGTILTLIFVVIHNSLISKVVNSASFLLLISNLISLDFTHIKSYLFQFIYTIYEGIHAFINDLFNSKKIRFFYYFKIIGIPLLLILFFFIIYYNSNTYFAEITDKFFKKIETFWDWIPSINISLFLTFIVGLILSIVLFYQKTYLVAKQKEAQLSLVMKRRRIPLRKRNFLALKSEYRSGIFLLICLNILLLVFNYSDVSTVWFSYEWNGGYLKNFVHQGTYLLISSLIASICIALYFFRGNLNFYSKNRLLKVLTYIWLSQNLLLIFSLFIRNTIYINHFSLAYKRIGVYAFLLATIIGIITILIKVQKKKSAFYIVKNNTFSIYFILVSLCFVNWDVFIAKYNLNSYDESFIELSFLTELSNKALPYVNLNHEKLSKLETQQAKSFSFSSRSYYMDKTTYKKKMENKIAYFLDSYPDRSWLEWNYSDYRAYHLLKNDAYEK